MSAYDTELPELRSEALAYITVLRNLNGPVFSPPVYRVTIDEQTPVNQYILKLNVTDPDNVSC